MNLGEQNKTHIHTAHIKSIRPIMLKGSGSSCVGWTAGRYKCQSGTVSYFRKIEELKNNLFIKEQTPAIDIHIQTKPTLIFVHLEDCFII